MRFPINTSALRLISTLLAGKNEDRTARRHLEMDEFVELDTSKNSNHNNQHIAALTG